MDPVEIYTEVYDSLWLRARGLIGRAVPPPGSGVLLSPCRQVHTFGLREGIDAVHLDEAHVVVHAQSLPPRRIGRWVRQASGVLELAAGEAERLGLWPGVRVCLLGVEGNASTNNEEARVLEVRR